jgi:hypothetical protein
LEARPEAVVVASGGEAATSGGGGMLGVEGAAAAEALWASCALFADDAPSGVSPLLADDPLSHA